MDMQAIVQLESCSFNREETLLVEHASLRASIFRYRSGVCAIRLTNSLGNLVILPYQGQQIWSMEFAGQSLAMQSMFPEPLPTQEYLATYGAFFLHCGMLSMGNPGLGDDHPVHGELPNALYQQAFIRAGADDKGIYLEVGGVYRHSIAFTCDYKAEPLVRLYEDATTVHIQMEVTNLRAVSMEYMYLAHINFKPVDFARLVYSAPISKDQVEIRQDNAEFIVPSPEYAAFMERIKLNPSLMDVIDPKHVLNNELVMYYQYIADSAGWAHSLQIQPDGYAGYVKHRPEELDKVVRWIVRTHEEDALGLALPSTATPEGYTAEKQKGNIRTLLAKSSVVFHLEAGLLFPDQAVSIEKHIGEILRRS